MPEESAVLDAPAEIPAESTDLGEALEQQDAPEEPAEDPVEDSEQADDEADSESPDDEEAPAEPVAPDGRKMPDSLKKGLAALKAVNPEAAKELRGLYFANQEYRSIYPTVAEAVQAKTLIEEIGGTEGVQQIAAEREEWGTLDQQYADGSKDFVTSIAEANPEAFLKVGPHVINEWATRAPEQYQYYAQSLTVNMLKNAHVPEQLSAAYHAAADNPALQAQIAGVYNSIVDMHEKSQQFAQKQQSVDPERQKFTQEKQQFEQQRRASFEEGILSQTKTYLAGKMDAAIKIVAANRTIDSEALPHYQQMINTEIERRLAQIPGFEAKLEAFYRTGNAAESAKYIQAQYDRILPDAAKVIAPLVRNLGPAPVAKKPAAAPVQGKPAVRSEVTLRDMPEWKDIDFSKCTTADVANGWAILKSGRKASGWA